MKKTIYIALAALFLASCSTSNDVASNNRIQKRKYTKGWYVKKSTNLKKTKGSHEEELVAEEIKENKTEELNFRVTSTQSEVIKDKEVETNLESLPISTPVAPVVEEVQQDLAEQIQWASKEAKSDTKKLSIKEKMIAKAAVNKIEKTIENQDLTKALKEVDVKSEMEKLNTSGSQDTDLILLYVLAVLIPFLAVGIVTNWDIGQVILNLVLCLLCGIPGIIHAIIVVRNNA